MISLRNVSKVYNIGGDEVRALSGVSLNVADGEFISVIGPSGSGKSTLMNIVGCLDVADEGEYLLDGTPIEHYSERELSRIRNRKIGFVFQGFNLLPKLTAAENVELPLIYQGMRQSLRQKRVEEALSKVGLSSRAMHKPTELSGGQQQRVAVARALVTRPSILLADEPTGNLDSKTGADIMELFCSLHRSGNTLVLITHNPEVAARAPRIVRIFDGKLEEGIC